jgi:histidine triad (HIT) family protein
MSADNCIFCKIAAHQIPARIIRETETCLAFLDINPLAPGHTLVIPKQHAEALADMTLESLSAVTGELPRLARSILAATGAAGLNVLQNNGPSAGQVVMHVHFHLIPRMEGDGLGFRWNTRGPDAQRDEAVAEHIRRHLAGAG